MGAGGGDRDGLALALTATVTRVRLVQAARAGAALGPEVSLMLSWLATRLGWKASSLAGKLRLLRADGVHLPVQLHAEDVSWTGRGSLRTLRRPVYDDALAESVAWADALRSDELACA